MTPRPRRVERARAACADPQESRSPWTRLRTGSGLRVSVATIEQAPLLRLRLAFAAGAQFDPPGREGLASLATPLLRVGSTRLDDRAVTAGVEELGTDLMAAADWELGSLTIELLPRHLDQALALLFDLTRPPDVRVSAFERARRTRLLQLHARPHQPAVLATDWLARAIFGHGTYGTSLVGSIHGLSALSHDDVRAFYARQITPAKAFLVAVGPVRADELIGRIDAALARTEPLMPPLPENGPLVPIPSISPMTRPGRAIFIVDTTSARTELRLGHVGVAQSHPDLPDLEIVNAMLGGGPSSRLYRTLQTQRRFTYSIHSRVVARRAPGPFTIATCVRHEVAGDTVGLVLQELHALRTKPAAPEEIALATGALTLARLRARTSVRALTDHLSFLETHDFRDDNHDNRDSRDNRPLDPERAAALARSHVHPDRLAIVAVGPARVLRAQLEQFGAVIEVDPTALEVQPSVA
jgi:zinc protease